MRRSARCDDMHNKIKILLLDDDIKLSESLSTLLSNSRYIFEPFQDPLEAIESIKNDQYDIFILDYIMDIMNGDAVVEKVRKFDKDLHIILLTGFKNIIPPLETIKKLDIQGYCEKTDNFDQLILLIESGMKTVKHLRTINKFQDGLNKILQAMPQIYHLQPIDQILKLILTQLIPFVNGKDSFILIDNIQSYNISQHKSMYRGVGSFDVNPSSFASCLNHNVMEKIGDARSNKESIIENDQIILPLINEQKECIGVIYVYGKIDPEWVKLLDIYSVQATSSISNAVLHSMLNIKNDELGRTYNELKTRYMDTIEALRLTVDAKDEYTRGHSDRVSKLAVLVGEKMGLENTDLEALRVSGVFHDIGKIAIIDDILLKEGKLDFNEFEEIKKHTIRGAHILSAVSMFKNIIPIVLSHHERIDGKGYPHGLKGNDIPYLSRILSVADAFDAMVSDRKYRKKLDIAKAIDQLIEGSGTQFDSSIVEKFIEISKTPEFLNILNSSTILFKEVSII